MTVTREDLIRMLSVESGYTMQDIRHLLHCMDDVIINELYSVTPDEEIAIQLMQGVKIICVPVAQRERKDPRNQNDIVCPATCKIKTRISQDLKLKMQENYNNKYNVDGE